MKKTNALLVNYDATIKKIVLDIWKIGIDCLSLWVYIFRILHPSYMSSILIFKE